PLSVPTPFHPPRGFPCPRSCPRYRHGDVPQIRNGWGFDHGSLPFGCGSWYRQCSGRGPPGTPRSLYSPWFPGPEGRFSCSWDKDTNRRFTKLVLQDHLKGQAGRIFHPVQKAQLIDQGLTVHTETGPFKVCGFDPSGVMVFQGIGGTGEEHFRPLQAVQPLLEEGTVHHLDIPLEAVAGKGITYLGGLVRTDTCVPGGGWPKGAGILKGIEDIPYFAEPVKIPEEVEHHLFFRWLHHHSQGKRFQAFQTGLFPGRQLGNT